MKFPVVMDFARHLIANIIKHNIGILAAVISFFGFSAMIPLFLLLIYGASILIPHVPVEQFLLHSIRTYVPTMPDSKMFLTGSIARLAALGPKVGIFGVLGLLWTTVGGFVSFQQILDMIWEIRHRRSFVFQYLVGFGMLGILLFLTVTSTLATALSPELIQKVSGAGVGTVQWLVLIQDISRISFPLLLFVTCFFCYRFLPSRALPYGYLLTGALISTIAIFVSRQIFVWYTGHLGRYELIYGTMTFIMLFVFWIYIVSNIVLFGAEFSISLHQVSELHRTPNQED